MAPRRGSPRWDHRVETVVEWVLVEGSPYLHRWGIDCLSKLKGLFSPVNEAQMVNGPQIKRQALELTEVPPSVLDQVPIFSDHQQFHAFSVVHPLVYSRNL